MGMDLLFGTSLKGTHVVPRFCFGTFGFVGMSVRSCSIGGRRLVRVQNFGVGSMLLQTAIGHSDKITSPC